MTLVLHFDKKVAFSTSRRIPVFLTVFLYQPTLLSTETLAEYTQTLNRCKESGDTSGTSQVRLFLFYVDKPPSELTWNIFR